MANPVTLKQPKTPSGLMQIVLGILILAPLLGLAWFWYKHENFHLEPPKLNLALYVALILVPIIWAALISATPMEYQETEEELLGESRYLDKLPMDWWTMFIMWATPLFALGALGHIFVTKWLVHPEHLSISPLRALSIMAVIFFLGWFYGVGLFARSEPRTLVSDAGIRTGVIRLHEWGQIHHLSRQGDLYALYHRVNPALPAACFRVRTPEAQATLNRYLAANQIPISNDTRAQFTQIKLGVVVAFLLNLGIAILLRLHTSLFLPWIVLISFGIGTVFTILLERIRGVSKYSKHMPIIEPAANDHFSV